MTRRGAPAPPVVQGPPRGAWQAGGVDSVVAHRRVLPGWAVHMPVVHLTPGPATPCHAGCICPTPRSCACAAAPPGAAADGAAAATRPPTHKDRLCFLLMVLTVSRKIPGATQPDCNVIDFSFLLHIISTGLLGLCYVGFPPSGAFRLPSVFSVQQVSP